MRHFLVIIGSIFLFSSCGSSGKLPYAWQGQAKAYTAKYKEMMLKGDSFQAAYYLKDAVKEAQNDVTLRTLAIVYLNECAMQKAMAIQSTCQSYETLTPLFKDEKLHAFKAMILGKKVSDRSHLDKYQAFYEALSSKELGVSDIKSLDTIYAQAIAAMLIKEEGLITMEMAEYMIDQASRENFKGLMLVWLDIAKGLADGEKVELFEKKIQLLKSKS